MWYADVRPEPLSAAVFKSSQVSVMTRAKLLTTIQDKVNEIKTDRLAPVSSE